MMRGIRAQVWMMLVALTVAPAAWASGGYALTWEQKTSPGGGLSLPECWGCNAYTGDTACTQSRPLLCLRQDGAPVPPGLSVDFYHGWAYGTVAATPPIPGTSLTSLDTANLMCTEYLGAGWRMAEFHDGGGGWGWYAHTYPVRPVPMFTRVWVHINDQPANCWNP